MLHRRASRGPSYNSNTAPSSTLINAAWMNQQHADSIGILHVQVLRASGPPFEQSTRTRCRLSLGSTVQWTTRHKKSLLNKKKPVIWNQEFQFNISHPTDFLSVTCVAGETDDTQVIIGQTSVALSHLPQNRSACKWYELKSNGESVAVVQLKLTYALVYTTHGSNLPSLTSVPSSQAREMAKAQSAELDTSKLYPRFVDYVLIVGVANPMCAAPNRPSLLERYPTINRPSIPVPDNIAMFAFPLGYQMSSTPRPPTSFSFQLSTEHKEQIYCTAITWWKKSMVPSTAREEDDDVDQYLVPRTPLQTSPVDTTSPPVSAPTSPIAASPSPSPPPLPVLIEMYVPTCMIFTSRLPCIPHHRHIQQQLYHHFLQHMSVPSPCSECHPNYTYPLNPWFSPYCIHTSPPMDPHGLTLEQYITLICEEIPLPSHGESITFTLADRMYYIHLPASELDFPHMEWSLAYLFHLLDADVILTIVRCMLCEMKLIFHSSQLSLLHLVSSACISLCFPFLWSHVYVPILPLDLLGILQAPVTLIAGIHTDHLPLMDETESSFVIVDIDRGMVETNVPPPPFPMQNVRVLMRGIRKLIRPELFEADQLQSTLSGPTHHHTSSSSSSLHDMTSSPPPPPLDRSASMASIIAARSESSLSASTLDPPSSIWHQLHSHRSRDRLIRHEFLQFLASLIAGYRDHISYVNGSVPVFDTPSFLRKGRTDAMPFLSKFLETQVFRDFLDKHIEYPSYMQDYLLYINAHMNPSTTSHDIPPFHVSPPTPLTSQQWSDLYQQYREKSKEEQSTHIINGDTVACNNDEPLLPHQVPVFCSWRFTNARTITLPTSSSPFDEHERAYMRNHAPSLLTTDENDEDEPVVLHRSPTAASQTFHTDNSTTSIATSTATSSSSSSSTSASTSTAQAKPPTHPHATTNGQPTLSIQVFSPSPPTSQLSSPTNKQSSSHHVPSPTHKLTSPTSRSNSTASNSSSRSTSPARSDSHTHTRPHHRRQFSGSLLARADEQKRLPMREMKIYQVVSGLLSPTPSSVPLDDLSAVGELLTLTEWRATFVEIMADYGLAVTGTEDKCVSTSSFLSLTLLFNLAVEECAHDHDYPHGRTLLQLSGKVYHIPDEYKAPITTSNSDKPGSAPSSHPNSPRGHTTAPQRITSPERKEREYLRYALKRQKLWQSSAFWEWCFMCEVNEVIISRPRSVSNSPAHSPRNASIQPPNMSLSGSSPSKDPSPLSTSGSSSSLPPPSQSTNTTSPVKQGIPTRMLNADTLSFQLVCSYIYLHHSLSLSEDYCRSFVLFACDRQHLAADKTIMLTKLVTQVYSTPQVRSVTADYASQTQAIRKNSPAAARARSPSPSPSPSPAPHTTSTSTSTSTSTPTPIPTPAASTLNTPAVTPLTTPIPTPTSTPTASVH